MNYSNSPISSKTQTKNCATNRNPIDSTTKHRDIRREETEDEDNESDDAKENELLSSWKSKPEDWSSDVRMNALFAPFRNRDLNPLHYDAKLKFWKETIGAYCVEKELLQLNLAHIECCFERDNKKPKCLELVLNEMIKEGFFKTRDDFLKPKSSGFMQTVLNKFVWSPLTWSTNYLLSHLGNPSPTTATTATATTMRQSAFKSSESSPTLTSSSSRANQSFSSNMMTSPKAGSMRSPMSTSMMASPTKLECLSSKNTVPLVFVELVESKALELMESLQSRIIFKNVDCVVEYERVVELAKAVLNVADSFEQDLHLLISYLQANNKILINDTILPNKRLIKFTSNMNSNVEPITQVESSYHELHDAERRLELESKHLSEQIETLNAQIKLLLKQNNKTAALRNLRKRKHYEKSLELKDSTISNIHTMLANIQQADTNKLAFDIYNRSVEALKEANKDLSQEKVEDTMFELHDALQDKADVENALAQGQTTLIGDTIDYGELEDELNQLLSTSAISASPTKPIRSKQSQNESESKSNTFKMNELFDSLPNLPEKRADAKQIAE